MFEYLKRERDAFELFKEAYRAQFPAGAVGPPPCAELNITVPKLAAEADADLARVSLLFVPLYATLLASVEEGRFAEIVWI
jgi:hypothetical protein